MTSWTYQLETNSRYFLGTLAHLGFRDFLKGVSFLFRMWEVL